MIKINVQSTVIPVTIGKHEFKFHADDQSIDEIKKKLKDWEAKNEEIEKLNDDEAQMERKAYLNKAFDSVLGKGAFDKIYEQTPSTIFLVGYFVMLMEGIGAEFDKQQQTDKLNKYLNK